MTLADHARRLKFRRPANVPAAWAVTDDIRQPDPRALVERLPPGTGLLLRHYDAGDRVAVAQRTARAAKNRHLMLVVAADWRLAAAVGAGGVHLPEALGRSGRLAPLMQWARRRGVVVSMACHSRCALGIARRLGVDLALLSPVFPTASHPGAAVIGAVRFRLWRKEAGIAVYALGGVNARNLARLNDAGFAAVSGWAE